MCVCICMRDALLEGKVERAINFLSPLVAINGFLMAKYISCLRETFILSCINPLLFLYVGVLCMYKAGNGGGKNPNGKISC